LLHGASSCGFPKRFVARSFQAHGIEDDSGRDHQKHGRDCCKAAAIPPGKLANGIADLVRARFERTAFQQRIQIAR